MKYAPETIVSVRINKLLIIIINLTLHQVATFSFDRLEFKANATTESIYRIIDFKLIEIWSEKE